MQIPKFEQLEISSEGEGEAQASTWADLSLDLAVLYNEEQVTNLEYLHCVRE